MKRQLFAISLLLVSFLFVISSKAVAVDCTCTNQGTTLVSLDCPADYECTCSYNAQMTGTICTAVPDATSDTGGPHEPCNQDNTCNGDLVCVSPRGVAPLCVTTEERDELFPGAVVSIAPKFDPFCIEGDKESGISTALGCIKVGTGDDLIKTILQLATGLGGGIALALILYGVFIVTTSAGMPDKLKAGSEIITSAIVGLVFILLSIFLVNLIGINILGIPGLS